jgi:hypothetical protein
MSKAPRTCVFYSLGNNYPRILKEVRARYLGTRLCAMVPPGHPFTSEDLAPADEVIETERARYSPRDVGACLRLIRGIRAGRFDRFVVLFESRQLQILAALSRAPHCECWIIDGRVVALSPSVLGVFRRGATRVLRGIITYIRTWMVVTFKPVIKIPRGNKPT